MTTTDILIAHFQAIDAARTPETRVHDTPHGIFGTADLRVVAQLLEKVHPQQLLVDLGSGDGRVALLASLHLDAIGIEADDALHRAACVARDALLPALPQVARCTLVHGNYCDIPLPTHATFFTYMDHPWPTVLEEHLRRCTGMLLSYDEVFAPRTLERGPIIWIGQVPIRTYPLRGDGG